MTLKILIIIPARGGSKGIPRKNIRPLNGVPLISYSIRTALKSKFNPDVYVSTDDDEIEFFARKFGAKVHKRNPVLSSDEVTLDPVIYDLFTKLNVEYDLIITLQPTSPLLKTSTLDSAIDSFIGDGFDSMISATDDTHLTWQNIEGKYMPLYKERLNRQYLPKTFKETGGFVICKSDFLKKNKYRISSDNSTLYVVSNFESIDIDNYVDWSICEYLLSKKKILFRVTGNSIVGLGHVYNCLIIAGNILNHDIEFLVDAESELAFERIKQMNYSVHIQKRNNIVDDIKALNPDLVINDCLDTSEEYMSELKSHGYLVVNFEDLGNGTKYADLVFNAIYPERESSDNHFFGPKYFIARDEFMMFNSESNFNAVKQVLVTFGGVDPCNLTQKVLETIYDYCVENSITINVVAGLGYEHYDSLQKFEHINIFRNVKHISEIMNKSDIAFSSAGRTIYELALMKVPTIVMAQNEREMTHFFASKEYGFLNLGLGKFVSKDEILKSFIHIVENKKLRKEMASFMEQYDLKNGKEIVISEIKKLLNKPNEIK